MALLKGSKIRFTEAEAIVGDTAITPAETAEVSSVVPRAPERPAGRAKPGVRFWAGDR